MCGFLKSILNSKELRYSMNATVLGLGICLLCPPIAHGQLRSGRNARPLYQVRLADAREAVPSAVEAASYTEPAMLSGDPMGHSSVIYDDGFNSVGGACDCGDCGACDTAPGYGCGSVGCDGMACAACCGGYSTIAPTATAVCPPGCGPLMRLWYRTRIRTEVPLYWRRAHGPPALVTTADAGAPPETAGRLEDDATTVLFGDGVTNEDATAGFRMTLSTHLGATDDYELMFRFWTAGDQDDSFLFDSSQFPILARPILATADPDAPTQQTQLIAHPETGVGNIRIETESSVSGLELTLKRKLYEDRFTRIHWLYGYQHVSIDEGFNIFSDNRLTNPPILQGARTTVADRFSTQNDFNGVSYGLMSSRRFALWKLETMFRLGAGNLRRIVDISGSSTIVSGGTTTTRNEGLLARSTNSRRFVDDTFVVVPEVGINLAYMIRPGFDFNIGYNYMLVPKVAQASQQINDDLAVNLSSPLVGDLDPGLQFTETGYWLHSLGFGFQLRY